EFSLFDDSIAGKNLEFEEGKLIKQEWYFGDQEEASIVTIKLHPKGTRTSVELKHTNIPDEVYDEMVEGWTNAYFGALQAFYI
ncbi:MAG: SRPBCC domain-containing protein, partial [Flavitalea sp.]